jgi:uncharacterized protein YdhG (YjbR/CyaY superfamily)
MSESEAKRPAGKRGPASRSKTTASGEAEVLAAIEAMEGPDREIALGVHAIVKANAPELVPRLWYGMPAYAKDAKVVCFFQAAGKFKTRYATLGFQHDARLDDGHMWPVAYALTALSPAEEDAIAALIRRAVS